MAAIFSKTTKLMLKNVIRHTNSHNKTVEEAEMWQQFERKKELGGLDPSNPSYGHDDRCTGRNERDRRRNDYWNSRSEKRAYLSTSSRSRRAHMDEEDDKTNGGSSTSTYWMRQLGKLESSDPNRWDHSGFRELYPNDFRSDRSDSDSSRIVSHRQKKDRTKKKKQRSKSKKGRQEKKSSRLHKKQARKRRPPSSSDESESQSDSFTSDSSPRPHRKGQHVSRKSRYDRTKTHRYASSDSSSSGSSYSGSDSGSDSRERSQSGRRKQSKRTGGSSVSKRPHYGSTKSGRYASSDSSSGSYSQSDSDSDSRERFQSRRIKPRKRTRDSSSVSASSSSDRSVSVSSPERKKVKTEKLGHKKRAKSKKGSKHKRRRRGDVGQGKLANREEEENQLVVNMWKEANGRGGSSDRNFDRRLQKEISSQYRSLKRQHTQKRSSHDAKVNGSSAPQLKKR